MQNKRILISLIVASVLGLMALFVATFVVKEEEAPKTVMAVAAGENISMGMPITVRQLKLVKLPEGSQPIGLTHNMEDLIGRVAKDNIAAGEIISDRMLYSVNASAGLGFSIAEGKRAMSMGVNEVSAVAGFVTPGSFVDVVFSGKDESGTFYSRIILQRVLVLAVAQDRSAPDNTKPRVATSVTLELTPQQVQVLDTARAAGSVTLVLRNQTEGATSIESTQTKSSNENGVEVIRGTSVRIEAGLGR